MCAIALLASCAAPPDNIDLLAQSPEEYTQPEHPLPPEPPAPPPREVTQAWRELVLVGGYPSEEFFVNVFLAPARAPAVEGSPHIFGGEPIAVVGDPDAYDTLMLGFVLRHPDAHVRVYTLGEGIDRPRVPDCPHCPPSDEVVPGGDPNDGGTRPGNLAREYLLCREVEGDRFTMLISGFSDTGMNPPQFRFSYAIVVETEEGEAVLYPTDISIRQWIAADNIRIRSFAPQPGNPRPEPEEDESGTSGRRREPHQFTDRDFDFISGFGLMDYSYGFLEIVWNNRSNTELNEFITQHNRTQGFGEGFNVSHTFVDMDGNLFYVVANELAEDLYIVRRDATTGEFEVAREISDRHEHDSRYLSLLGSDLHFFQNTPRHPGRGDSADRLVRFALQSNEIESETQPDADGIRFEPIITQRERDALRYSHNESITWLINPIVNPNNLEEHLLFGVLHGVDQIIWDLEDSYRLIVMLRRGNRIANWFITDEIDTENAYINVFNTMNIIGGVDPGLGSVSGRPYSASFSGNTVEIHFPASFIAFTFDFDSFAVSGVMEIDESFRFLRSSQFMHSTLDGRFELWQANRAAFNALDVVYDTHTGRIISFPNASGVSFISNTEVGSVRGAGVDLLDLTTMEAHRVELGSGQHRSIVDAYIWDHYRNRHIILDSEWHGPFVLSFYDQDGNFLHSIETQMQGFYQQQSWEAPEVRLIADGQLYITDQFNQAGSFLMDLDTGEVSRMRYLPVELPRIERMLQGEPMGYNWMGPVSGTQRLSRYISGLHSQAHHTGRAENAAETYEMILGAVGRLGGDDFLRVPGSEMIYHRQEGVLFFPQVADDAFSVGTFRFGGAGELYGLWQPDGDIHFIVGVHSHSRGFGSTSQLAVLRINADGSLTADNSVTFALPRGITSPGGALRNLLLRVNNWQFTDMQVHSEGDALVLTYLSAETDSREPFARVIYRDGMFEVFAA